MNGKFSVKTLAALASTCLMTMPAFAREVTLRTGKYEFTVTYEVQGERQNESRTTTRCIQQQDLIDPENIFTDQLPTARQQETCSVRSLKSGQGKISYDADCFNRTVHVEGELSSAEFSVVRTVTPKASASVLLRFTVRGKRLGDCGAKGTD